MELKKTFGLFDALNIGIGAIIGAGQKNLRNACRDLYGLYKPQKTGNLCSKL